MTTPLIRQRGLTLVELMVAATLSMVLMGGVLLVFSANKTTYQMQNGMGTLQENGRYAIRQITTDLQLAGYAGCQSPQVAKGPPVYNVVTSPPAHLTDYTSGIFFDGRNDQPTTVTYGGIAMVIGTDALEIRGPLRAPMTYVTGEFTSAADIVVNGTTSGFTTNEYLVVGDCQGSTIFRATNVTINTGANTTTIAHGTALNTQATLRTIGFSADSTVTGLDTHTYFIGAPAGRTNDAGQQVTALYRFDGTNSVELVDGVEDLQVQFALDTNGDGLIDAFANPGGVTDWSEVMSVKVSLLINSVNSASGVEAPYTFFPASSVPIAPATGDFRLRQEFSAMVSIRNSIL